MTQTRCMLLYSEAGRDVLVAIMGTDRSPVIHSCLAASTALSRSTAFVSNRQSTNCFASSEPDQNWKYHVLCHQSFSGYHTYPPHLRERGGVPQNYFIIKVLRCFISIAQFHCYFWMLIFFYSNHKLDATTYVQSSQMGQTRSPRRTTGPIKNGSGGQNGMCGEVVNHSTKTNVMLHVPWVWTTGVFCMMMSSVYWESKWNFHRHINRNEEDRNPYKDESSFGFRTGRKTSILHPY